MRFWSSVVYVILWSSLWFGLASVDCWKFDVLGLDENLIELKRIAVYGLRAFVAIPRVSDQQPVTLVEVPWPERSLYTIYNTRPFPKGDSQTIGQCEELQSVITLEVDTARGRLYILDRGINSTCPAKIIIYDLRTNREILRNELNGVPSENLNALAIDVHPYTKTIRLMLADAGNSSILVYNLSKQTWWKMSVSLPVEQYGFDHGFDQLVSVPTNGTLYVASSQSNELYAINLNEFRRMEEPSFQDDEISSHQQSLEETDISISYVGDKLGKSVAMTADSRGNLYYIYRRDYAILKWNPSTSMSAENTEVLMQNATAIPYAVQIFADSSTRQLWVLNSKRNDYGSYIVKLKTAMPPNL